MAADPTTALIISAFGIAVTTLITALGYFAKKKLESIESDIKKLDKKLEQMEKQTREEHKVSVSWMSRITNALLRNDIEVEKPDEISETIDVNESD